MKQALYVTGLVLLYIVGCFIAAYAGQHVGVLFASYLGWAPL
jgi:uncharacterized membrane protein YhdT